MFVARQLASANLKPEAIDQLKFALENATAKAGDGEAAIVRVDQENTSKLFLVRAPGVAAKPGKVTLQTDKGTVEGYAIATAKPPSGWWETIKSKSLYVGAAGGAGTAMALFAPVVIPLLESACASVGLPPTIAAPAWWIADALTSGAVMIPLYRGQTSDQKIDKLANTTIDFALADNAETLNVIRVDR